MATVIRPEISQKNKYWISKHRHYELKHFCLQYPIWKKAIHDNRNSNYAASNIEWLPSNNLPSDPTSELAMENVRYLNNIKLIERVADETDKYLASYILRAVTEGFSYIHLKSRLEIPCSRDMFYDRYRRFFWLLSQVRN